MSVSKFLSDNKIFTSGLLIGFSAILLFVAVTFTQGSGLDGDSVRLKAFINNAPDKLEAGESATVSVQFNKDIKEETANITWSVYVRGRLIDQGNIKVGPDLWGVDREIVFDVAEDVKEGSATMEVRASGTYEPSGSPIDLREGSKGLSRVVVVSESSKKIWIPDSGSCSSMKVESGTVADPSFNSEEDCQEFLEKCGDDPSYSMFCPDGGGVGIGIGVKWLVTMGLVLIMVVSGLVFYMRRGNGNNRNGGY